MCHWNTLKHGIITHQSFYQDIMKYFGNFATFSVLVIPMSISKNLFNNSFHVHTCQHVVSNSNLFLIFKCFLNGTYFAYVGLNPVSITRNRSISSLHWPVTRVSWHIKLQPIQLFVQQFIQNIGALYHYTFVSGIHGWFSPQIMRTSSRFSVTHMFYNIRWTL